MMTVTARQANERSILSMSGRCGHRTASFARSHLEKSIFPPSAFDNMIDKVIINYKNLLRKLPVSFFFFLSCLHFFSHVGSLCFDLSALHLKIVLVRDLRQQMKDLKFIFLKALGRIRVRCQSSCKILKRRGYYTR